MLPLWCTFALARELQHVRWVLAIWFARQFWARICLAQFLARIVWHADFHRFRLICKSLWTLRLLYTLLGAIPFWNYSLHLQWFWNLSKPFANCYLKQYLAMRLQELKPCLKRTPVFVLRSSGPRSLRPFIWLATAKNRWLGSFHRQCELNPDNCLTTNCLWAIHTRLCRPTYHGIRRIWCSWVL